MFQQALANWATGLALVFDPYALLLILVGVVLGLFFGAVPGLTATLAMVLLLPLTYGMEAIAGFGLLMGAYIGGITGGLVSATMIGIPGTPASIVTTYDAHPMARRGEGGRALGLGFASSFLGGLIGWIVLVFLTPQLSRFALQISPAEYAVVILFGFTIITGMSSEKVSRSFLMTAIGLIVAAVGMDQLHGTPRLTLGMQVLQGGFGLVPLLSGIFVVSRALEEAETILERYVSPPGKITQVFGQLRRIWRSWVNVLRSSAIGVGVGILPGVGAAVAPFISYDRAKKRAKDPATFGTGDPDGIIASETCNNASIGGALIPALALGIPGDVPIVVLLGGFMLQGFQPGPLFFSQNLDMVYAIYVSYFVANLLMLILGLSIGVRMFSRIMAIPKVYLIPIILVAGLVGSYNVAYSMTDIWVSLIAGTLAYIAKKADYPLTPLVIAIILGPMLEYNLRVALNVSKGSLLPFVTEPVAIVFLLLTLVSIVTMYLRRRKGKTVVA